jgi:hypothetical protein
VLGLLEEYDGRPITEDSNRIERFYCSEGAVARLFRRSIGTLATQQGLDPLITEETTQECLVSYYSREVTGRLNSCYVYQTSAERLVRESDGRVRRTAKGSLSPLLFSRTAPPRLPRRVYPPTKCSIAAASSPTLLARGHATVAALTSCSQMHRTRPCWSRRCYWPLDVMTSGSNPRSGPSHRQTSSTFNRRTK